MSKADIRVYRTMLWLKLNEQWAQMQREAWRPILRAVERSNESKAALVLKSGGFTRAIITIEFFQGEEADDALVRLSVDRRDGNPPQEYIPYPEEVMAYLARLLEGTPFTIYNVGSRWEPV